MDVYREEDVTPRKTAPLALAYIGRTYRGRMKWCRNRLHFYAGMQPMQFMIMALPA